MSVQRVTIIDQQCQVVATAQVAEQDGTFAGRIDLRPMSAALRHQFEAYEEIVTNHMFGLLDDIEEKIGNFSLKVVFENGREAGLADVQIYPSTKQVSFKVVQETVDRTGSA